MVNRLLNSFWSVHNCYRSHTLRCMCQRMSMINTIQREMTSLSFELISELSKFSLPLMAEMRLNMEFKSHLMM